MAVKIDKGMALGSLSLTPLIDVVFLLLIFFLVATRFEEEERELDIVLPQASEAKPLIAQPKELFVNVTENGRYFVSGELLTEAGLETALKQAWMNNPGRQRVIIRADGNSRTKHIATVMNLCNRAGIRDYSLATE
ncbi:MAG: biopolymer transporter ExbD [Pirellulales bacterium]